MLRDLTDGHRTIRRWLSARRLRRRFRKSPQFTVDALPEDTLGRITGTVQPFATQLAAPISGRPCVYWVLEIVEDVGEDWPSSKILATEQGVPFVVVHEGHRAIVEPQDATVSLAFDRDSSARGTMGTDGLQRAVLARYLPHRDFQHAQLIHFREAVIAIGETISVLGSGIREPDPEAAPSAAYRDAGRTRLRLTSSRKHPLCITDDPRVL
jgi:hypothetical protein